MVYEWVSILCQPASPDQLPYRMDRIKSGSIKIQVARQQLIVGLHFYVSVIMDQFKVSLKSRCSCP